jgi:superfamily I DNA and/or RNA helicase
VERLITGSNQSLQQIDLNKIRVFLDEAEAELDVFRDWTRYQQCLADLKQVGAGAFIDSLQETTITPDLWYRVLQRAIYKRWLTHIYDESTDLNDFSAKIHERRISEFSRQDSEQFEIAQKRLQQIHAHQWESWSEQSGAKEKLLILNREAVKQQKHKSVREFIKETEDLVPALKPCWMMSPLAVSEFIDPQIPVFDVVIFDEASQILTEEAIPAILRAKQVIVVGDDKQLPPTFSFNKFDTDDDNGGDDENCESLLVECSRFMKDFTLQWHYRSQDESLIAFSNEYFYDSKLVTFPNPTRDITRGVHFHYVENGIYDRGGKTINIHEAEEVAKLALEHAKTSQQTLGIIAFSKNQANAIQKELDRLSAKNSELAELLLDVQVFRRLPYELDQEWILGDLSLYHSYVCQRASK